MFKDKSQSGSFNLADLADSKQAWKIIVMQTLFQTIEADLNDNKKAYIRGVKNILRLLKPYIAPETAKGIEETFQKHKAELDKINEEAGTSAQLESKKLNLDYTFYDEIMVFVHDSLGSSPVMEHEIDGVLIYDNTEESLKKYGSAVRKTLDIKEVERGDTLSEKKPDVPKLESTP